MARDVKDSWIAARYRRRATPEYPHQPVGARHKQWQPDVYIAARALAGTLGATRIIDVGCGNGAKLIELATACPTIGLDRGANLERARATAPGLDWREHDLQDGSPLPLTPAELAGAIVLNADVIEHLPDPHALLAKLRGIHAEVELILLSTPERHLTRGLRDPGPPGNPAHIQEWTARELGAVLRAAGMPIHSLGLIRAHDHSDNIASILVAIARDPARLAAVDDVLIDLEIPASKTRLFGLLR